MILDLTNNYNYKKEAFECTKSGESGLFNHFDELKRTPGFGKKGVT